MDWDWIEINWYKWQRFRVAKNNFKSIPLNILKKKEKKEKKE